MPPSSTKRRRRSSSAASREYAHLSGSRLLVPARIFPKEKPPQGLGGWYATAMTPYHRKPGHVQVVFENDDGTVYYFPGQDVATWVVHDTTGASPNTPRDQVPFQTAHEDGLGADDHPHGAAAATVAPARTFTETNADITFQTASAGRGKSNNERDEEDGGHDDTKHGGGGRSVAGGRHVDDDAVTSPSKKRKSGYVPKQARERENDDADDGNVGLEGKEREDGGIEGADADQQACKAGDANVHRGDGDGDVDVSNGLERIREEEAKDANQDGPGPGTVDVGIVNAGMDFVYASVGVAAAYAFMQYLQTQ